MAQNPNWTVNENEFEFSMTRVAFLNVQGNNLGASNDQVAAFVNGEVRGVASLSDVSSSTRKYAYLTIFSNTDGATINYKIYNSTTDQVIDVPKTDVFQINQHQGDLYQAFSIANPTLNDGVRILDFRFDNQEELDVIVYDDEVVIKLDESIPVNNLVSTFQLSAGAQLLQNGQVVSSGTTLDFTTAKSYTVRSQDESSLKNWTVRVERVPNAINNATATFFKKDAVCFNKGMIKISFPINNAPVVLKKDGVQIATGVVTDKTMLFTELTQGAYTVEIGSYNKSISINLNQ
jgi:hypothetical protein